MPDWSELERLPAGVVTQRTARSVYAVRGDLASPLAAAGFSVDSGADLPRSDLAGRTALGELVAGRDRFVVRRFAHGGLLRWLTGSRYLNPLRPFREFGLARRLIDLGVRVPEVVAARARRDLAGTWELELVSRRVEGALDLGTLLVRTANGAIPRDIERACARALGALVRRLHDLEFLHGDLTPRNVLVEEASLAATEPTLWIVDLDGSRFVPDLTQQARAGNIGRLWRHVERMQRAGLVPRAKRICASFLRSYEHSGARRTQLLRAISESHRRARGWHVAAEILERGVGARRSQPLP